MLFEWDPAKAEANLRKHGVDFDTASRAFADPHGLDKLDPRSELHGEDRYKLTGMVGGDLLVVIYTERTEKIRIISARRANRNEHDHYYRQAPQE